MEAKLDTKINTKQPTVTVDCTSPSNSDTQNIPYSIEMLRSKLIVTSKKPRFDETKTLLFKQGHNNLYSDGIFVYEGHSSGQPVFAELLNYEVKDVRNLSFSDNLLKIIREAGEDFQKIGWIIVHEHKWGFLLDLDALEPLYNGQIPQYWKNLVKYEFISEEFIKYAHYHYDSLEHQEVNLISGTEFDPQINPAFCPVEQALFYHQKREVGWMFNIENDHNLALSFHMTHVPFLDTGFYIHNTTKEITVEQIDKKKSRSITGTPVPSGILASQIGSGKTVSMIGLISVGSQFAKKKKKEIKNSSKAQKGKIYEEVKTDASKKQKVKITDKQHEELPGDGGNIDDLRALYQNRYEPSLVIVTKNILHQWKSEFEKFAPFLRVFMWEKASDIKSLKFGEYKYDFDGERKLRIKKCDVILTHRAVIEELQSNSKPEFTKLYKVKFRRVIIDEIHELVSLWDKQKKSRYYSYFLKKGEEISVDKFYDSLISFKRDFTWGITGTPNNLNFYTNTELLLKLLNLHSQFRQLNVYKEFKAKFLKAHVRANPCSVSLPPLNRSCVQAHFNQVQNLMYQVKLSYATDEHEVRYACSSMLPQYEVPEFGSVDLSIKRAVSLIYQKHQDELERVTISLSKSPYDQRLCQRLKDLEGESNFYLQMIEILQKNEVPCPICMGNVDVTKLVITGCVHSLCVDCYAELTKTMSHPMCPLCRNYMPDDQLVIHPRFQKDKVTKLSAILEEIWKVPDGEKIIIFTQFNDLVEKLQSSFRQTGIQYIALKGKPSEINISLKKFETISEIKVLLLSVEQAASGVNITAANHVFFAHPIFGMPMEKVAITYNQCIGRAYRIGQQKPVHVKMFVTKNSIETQLKHPFLDSQLLTF